MTVREKVGDLRMKAEGGFEIGQSGVQGADAVDVPPTFTVDDVTDSDSRSVSVILDRSAKFHSVL